MKEKKEKLEELGRNLADESKGRRGKSIINR
jgi:hypothetical protein